MAITQTAGFAAAIFFGVWAPLSYRIAIDGLREQIKANELTRIAIEDGRASYNKSVEAERQGTVQIRLATMQLCAQNPVSKLFPIQ
jgi:hypothetical protein